MPAASVGTIRLVWENEGEVEDFLDALHDFDELGKDFPWRSEFADIRERLNAAIGRAIKVDICKQ